MILPSFVGPALEKLGELNESLLTAPTVITFFAAPGEVINPYWAGHEPPRLPADLRKISGCSGIGLPISAACLR